MPEKADISRTLLLPFMSIILLVAVYMTANVLLPLKASGKGSKESEDVQERQHLSGLRSRLSRPRRSMH